ncbi:DUF4363 family protein [Clostridium botulinum]|uniref:DUF4363 domain-containing protein n=1 Tax=Clostridium botulinum C/D str. DC5 TaxID=1443128 RepID=A0A0A0ID46_CLOBO|nr:DUF4363 family protein [Clostridium botulinum]KEI06651.1 hypothetical protein Z952_03590 [Clostridium botulinum C/D str. BKT75002]KEI09563.1 hypothetical protein Z954_12150 [Clostridium botulinum C/D str. BKT2873]KGM93415.1 hypothetical protein Z956_11715 [Clostridium botulinum D str. CCUG 7971]KGM98857.1 hypothetical protein Z955_10010 [Clostridium botulinum C/D str. DC5]KOC46891.1 hypothetical protein ADU88_11260 [Clostridium botulinum]
MKNIFTSFVIFVLLTITISISIHYLNTKYYYYSDKIDSLEELVSKDDWNKAYDSSLSFLKNWEKDSKMATAYIHHVHVESISSELLQLTQYIKYQDKVESLASIHEIKFLLKEITEIQKINITNVF